MREELRALVRSFEKLSPYEAVQARLALLPVCGVYFELEQIAALLRIAGADDAYDDDGDEDAVDAWSAEEALLARSRSLLDAMPSSDREDAVALHEQLSLAIEHRRPDEVARRSKKLEDLLFSSKNDEMPHVPHPWREEPECRRCGSGMVPLMRISAAAWRQRVAAADCLAARRWSEVLHRAREANRLQRTEAGDDLLPIARLLAG